MEKLLILIFFHEEKLEVIHILLFSFFNGFMSFQIIYSHFTFYKQGYPLEYVEI